MPNYLANRCFNSLSEMSAFAVDTTDEDGLGPFIVPIDATSYKVLVWRKNSIEPVDNVAVFSANGPGRWIALSLDSGGGGGGSLVTVSSTPPGTIQPSGTVYVWAEDDTSTYSADVEGRYPNSLITYVSNGSIWLDTNANKIYYSDSPNNVGKLPNSIQEEWIDTSTAPSSRYGALFSSSSGFTWEQI